jgi:hypothetical protein
MQMQFVETRRRVRAAKAVAPGAKTAVHRAAEANVSTCNARARTRQVGTRASQSGGRLGCVRRVSAGTLRWPGGNS